jgi:hypothetical protein
LVVASHTARLPAFVASWNCLRIVGDIECETLSQGMMAFCCRPRARSFGMLFQQGISCHHISCSLRQECCAQLPNKAASLRVLAMKKFLQRQQPLPCFGIEGPFSATCRLCCSDPKLAKANRLQSLLNFHPEHASVVAASRVSEFFLCVRSTCSLPRIA